MAIHKLHIDLSPVEVDKIIVQRGIPLKYCLMPKNHDAIAGKQTYHALLTEKLQALLHTEAEFSVEHSFETKGTKTRAYFLCAHKIAQRVEFTQDQLLPGQALRLTFFKKCQECNHHPPEPEQQPLPAQQQPQNENVAIVAQPNEQIQMPQINMPNDITETFQKAADALYAVLIAEYHRCSQEINPRDMLHDRNLLIQAELTQAWRKVMIAEFPHLGEEFNLNEAEEHAARIAREQEQMEVERQTAEQLRLRREQEEHAEYLRVERERLEQEEEMERIRQREEEKKKPKRPKVAKVIVQSILKVPPKVNLRKKVTPNDESELSESDDEQSSQNSFQKMMSPSARKNMAAQKKKIAAVAAQKKNAGRGNDKKKK